jgi:SAM-dependent methyltransferase
MDLGFRGEVAELYHRYRHGYPPAVIDALVRTFELTGDDVVVDLGCGTGQLAVPMAARVRAVAGIDPESDMLIHARRAATEQGRTNTSWLIGADTDTPALLALLGHRTVGAVTIGQALHWMNHDVLFPALATLVRPGGGVAVVTNGKPLWQQETPWSQVLCAVLEQWLGRRLTRTCGTDDTSQHRYADALTAAGFAVTTNTVDHTVTLTVDQIIGGVYSAMSPDQLPTPADRPKFAHQVQDALRAHAPFVEDVRVTLLTGRIT